MTNKRRFIERWTAFVVFAVVGDPVLQMPEIETRHAVQYAFGYWHPTIAGYGLLATKHLAAKVLEFLFQQGIGIGCVQTNRI